MFKIKDRYKLELQTPETMKLFGSTKNPIELRMENNVPILEVFEVVLVQCNFVDNERNLCYCILLRLTNLWLIY